ncbi:MAG: hypothetical protein D6760_02485 [Deltaproteobacteria bacterium]|nr:MAG: hypothetical protein D6760_02485 [Deltaproteobacteria bacterium]
MAVPAGKAAIVAVPKAALQRIGQLLFLTVLDEDGRPVRRMVTAGRTLDDDRIEILSGLAAGERYLVAAAEPGSPT